MSAVGKDTFCRYMLDKPSSELLTKLNLTAKKISFSDLSLITGTYTGDPAVNDRLGIPQEVESLLRNNDAVLIKWQYIDMSMGIFEQVSKTNPHAQISIILLRADDPIVASRLLNKKWWQRMHAQDDPNQNVQLEKKMVQDEMEKLKDAYPVTIVDSKPDYNFT